MCYNKGTKEGEQHMIIKIWKIWGTDLSPVYIIGKDLDEALAKARLINRDYDTSQLYSKEEIDND